MNTWLKTNEQEEAMLALEMISEWSALVEKRIEFWKWIVLAIHNATQGFMVLALRGSDGLRPLKDKVADAWLIAYRNETELPREELDTFLNLYKKIKTPSVISFFVHSRQFIPSGNQGRSIKKLNSIRNEFIHFVPKSWSIEVSGLPDIALDCLSIIEFLGWECGNVIWHDESVKERAKKALSSARASFQQLSIIYNRKFK